MPKVNNMAPLEPPFLAGEGFFCEPDNLVPGPQQQLAASQSAQTIESQGLVPGVQQQPAASEGAPATGSHSIEHRPVLVLPAVYTSADEGLKRVQKNLDKFFSDEMDVSRLNDMDKHLWLAGTERPARSLHTQISLGREIFVNEKVDLHLLWTGTRIYVKPLPDFLLCHSVWEQYICKNRDLFRKSLGFLLSYIWLVQRESDLRIAHKKGLVSSTVTWKDWVAFVESAIPNIDHRGLRSINIRYRRAELRLNRVNWIYRFCSETRSLKNFFRGYFFAYHNYGTFIGRNLSWLTASVVYIAVALTAMQVGLATKLLNNNEVFQRASYGFTIFSIVAPLLVLGGLALMTLFLVIWNWNFAVKSKKSYAAEAVDDSKG